MDWTSWLPLLDAPDSWVAREIVQRGVAAVFVLAFLSSFHQFPVLLGERGLLPVPAYLARAGGRAGPTLFRRVPYSDRLLRGMCLLGMGLGLAVVLGLPQQGPAWTVLAVFGVMWGMYLSIVSVGQVFYGFGWESMLLECGALVGLLGSHAVPPPQLMIVFLWWLLIRLEFGAGMIKMRGDRSWRDLTAMDHHHQTQPMPGPLSRAAHLMPRWWHRLEVLGSHAVQLGLVWLVLAPQPLASVAAFAVIATQLFLVVTGNYAWLNWLTILVACAAISDPVWRWLAGGPLPGWSWLGIPLGADGGGAAPGATSPLWWTVLVLAAFAGLAVRSRRPLVNLFSPHQLMNASFDRFHLVNAYGAFGTMTQRRYEVLIEGTEDPAGPDAEESSWRPYEFRGKPGDVHRRGRQVAPYHLRLDWQMWFLALRPGAEPWFVALLERLREGDPGVRRLLRTDPFDGRAPTGLRVRYLEYRFTDRRERRQTGAWWHREDLGVIARR
ncbi:lipase maturation factor family protein [Brachybacterium saurashtrense]|uniref:Lipase maturation factor family protein n=1 Tax=Brachybacterium saurashtrense TaxID=556288 RepID=A0A345YK65_9MICO|nr:lipase maturation factor family protein [Brachybacterium saurashtrense]AXK44317.1 lipase maturation factor family protein [Brachybacterium saurashtrense]RRR21353.1 lipase maturation factor family protein [Brachybacterium saurashtrense]RRR22928.1 lipase maturation factor family protein [Brachybacterium saurashtrense]